MSMRVADQRAFEAERAALCQAHSLYSTGFRLKDRLFEEIFSLFGTSGLQVSLVVTWPSSADDFHTLSLHRNDAGEILLAQDGPGGRLYFFPERWLPSRITSAPAVAAAAAAASTATGTPAVTSSHALVQANARSRFSTTPQGRATGYKQHRYARETELYFQGGRILQINGASTEGEHTGKQLVQALQAHPEGIQLLIELP